MQPFENRQGFVSRGSQRSCGINAFEYSQSFTTEKTVRRSRGRKSKSKKHVSAGGHAILPYYHPRHPITNLTNQTHNKPMSHSPTPENNQSDEPQENSALKKVALPASVIFMSCFCGIIACGVTCNFLGSPINVAPRNEFGNLPWIYRIAIFLVYVVSVYVGWIVSKGVIRRYRGEQS